MSDDSIRRSDAIKAVNKAKAEGMVECPTYYLGIVPSADRPKKVVAQITFDEEKLREIVKEAVERFKEEYEITDRPQGEWEFIGDNMFRCTSCGELYSTYQFENLRTRITDPHPLFPKGCPHCGARMKGADDE